MNRHVRLLGLAFATAWLVPGGAARAAIERIEVMSRADVADGAAYGLAGGFEKLAGRIYFSVDPELPANRVVRDLDRAARNGAGRVEFSSDFYLIKPKDIAHGNGTLLFEVSNRGNKGILPMLDFAARSRDPVSADALGDGFLLRNGFSLLWVGWQFDVPEGPDMLRVYAPTAGSDAAPVRGRARSDFVVRRRTDTQSLGDRGHRAYPAESLDSAEDLMTVRDSPDGERRTVPRADWQFARLENGRVVPDPTRVTLRGGFEPNKIYEVVYASTNPPIAGTGLAAIRDAVSGLVHDGAAELGLPRGSLERSIAFGISQSGRLLRTFLYDGFNADERGRRVFDGVMAHIAGGARGSFNHRFAQPSRASWSYFYPNAIFPFTDAPETDPATGRTDGLLEALEATARPRIFYTNSSNEYWRGTAALTHMSPDARRDVVPPDNVRIYLFAGTQHVPSAFPPTRAEGQQRGNPNDYSWFLRALVLAMQRWIADDAAPPPSSVPTLAAGTLVERRALRFPDLPGVAVPGTPRGAQRLDFGPEFAARGIIDNEPPQTGAPFPVRLPQVDADGNETSGLRSPELAVPLATYTGWNLYARGHGPETELVSLQGSFIPFPATAAQRRANGDPRRSVEERYSSRAQYLGLVATAATELIDAGYVLEADLRGILDAAGTRFDEATRASE